jgi:hypothetical protein
MSTVSAPTEQLHSDACREWQKFFDDHLRDVGATAQPFIPGQHALDYARESCRTFKHTFLPQNHELYKVNWRGLPTDALQALVPQLMDACKKEAENPRTVPSGEFRAIKTHNPYTGRVDAIKYVGSVDAQGEQDCFVKHPEYGHRPGRLARIRNPTTDPGWFPKEVPSVWMSGRVQAA